SNWLERLPAGSITTWEDLTNRFLAQFVPPGRTIKLRNDILMFQQYQRESLSEAWTRFKDLLQKVPRQGIDLWLQEDLALYDNKSWNDLRDFAKPVKAISLPQDVPMNKITSLCEISSGPHDTQYYMENLKQAFVEYASSRIDEAGGDDGDVMFIEIVKKNDDSRKEEPEAGGLEMEPEQGYRELGHFQKPRSITQSFKGSGYQQKDRKPSQNDKTEHGMKKTVQKKAKDQKSQRQSQSEDQTVKPEPELKNTIRLHLNPSDRAGESPISITMKNGEDQMGPQSIYSHFSVH
ncbi:MAK10-like protein, partial [Tanacetum coccineum]